MSEALQHVHSQPDITQRAGVWWDARKRQAAAAATGILSAIGLTGCDPDGPYGSLPDIPINIEEAPFRAAGTSEPQTDAERWQAAEQLHNIDKFINYRRMLDAMHRFAAQHRGAALTNPGWFFEKYETAEKLSGVPKEVIMAVHGIETTFGGSGCAGTSYDGPMQMGASEFSNNIQGVVLPPPDRGPVSRCSVDWALVAGGRYLARLGARDGDAYATEMALRRYNSGSTSAGVGYAQTAMRVAREGGLGY